MSAWQLQQAKARLSELVKRARSEGPQGITVRGEPVAVVLSHADYERLRGHRPSFVEFIRSSPLAGGKLDTGRRQTPTREATL